VLTCVPFSSDLLDSHSIIDVRTPLEYAEDCIPGAINIPLLSNDERVEIGTIYKQSGPHDARVRGLELTSVKLPAIVAAIADASQGRPILVYCWRGGLRSKTVATILELTGYKAKQLTGGYKFFRQQVLDYFCNFISPGPLVTLHGMTGVGKTDFLQVLKMNGFSTIDLEGLACHRGSAFGSLGMVQNHTQKKFDTQLWHAFVSIPKGSPIILEGESRRIGSLSLPGNLYEAMREQAKIWCTASIETRIDRLQAEYGKNEYKEEMNSALFRIRSKLGKEKHAEMLSYLEHWELKPLISELIENYYDKLYYKTKDWQEEFTLSLEDYELASAELTRFCAKYNNVTL